MPSHIASKPSARVSSDDQQHCTVSEVTVDWHLYSQPLSALTDSWARGAGSRHATTPVTA